ncbi:MAG: hybrid sensor histidine kinase/response regulator [Chloroflexi bacterium]|nr:hybrid sensor histidine kinase/response regulator [Chloroflexota bacterium]
MIRTSQLDSPSLDDATEQSTILLVDDDPAILEGVADLLGLYGYQVITAPDGFSALERMQSIRPDLVISDIMMPGMDGYQFFEAVRENPAWMPIPFIFLTARGQRSDIRRGQSLGADAYLTKPFEPEDLLIAVQARLKRAHDLQLAAHADVEQMKQQLITIFSHELRTPLAYIYGYVNLLRDQRDDLDEPAIAEMIEGAHRGTQRLVSLVEDLMLMVQIESGVLEMEISLEKGRMPIQSLVRTAVEKCQWLAKERDVQLEVEIDPGIGPCQYSLYIENALVRLIDNAIKFSRRATGCVWVRAYRLGDEVRIEVEDNGIGIAPDKQQVIFERFYQLDRDVMEQQGVGLGLSLARQLVRLHGGDITVSSRVGEGSIFTISLPAEKPDAADNGQCTLRPQRSTERSEIR